MNKFVFIALVLLLVGIIVVAGWNIYSTTTEYETGDDTYDDLQAFVQVQTTPPTEEPTENRSAPTKPQGERFPEETEATEPPPTEAPDDTLWPVVDFEALKEINPDVVGWIYIEGTSINYPVVQCEDNDYYLDHLFNGKKNRSGCIFLDYRCHSDLSSRHSIIYGHNMNNGAMFADLTKYRRQSFYDAHPTILVLTPDRNFKVEIFSGYVVKANDDAWLLDLNDRNAETWLAEVVGRSMFQSSIQPKSTDQIFTLSTCTYDFDQARLVIHGIIH